MSRAWKARFPAATRSKDRLLVRARGRRVRPLPVPAQCGRQRFKGAEPLFPPAGHARHSPAHRGMLRGLDRRPAHRRVLHAGILQRVVGRSARCHWQEAATLPIGARGTHGTACRRPEFQGAGAGCRVVGRCAGSRSSIGHRGVRSGGGRKGSRRGSVLPAPWLHSLAECAIDAVPAALRGEALGMIGLPDQRHASATPAPSSQPLYLLC